jgi:hypothetical protein
MGMRPSPQHTIDRRDNDGPYSPENCEWATKKVQGRNTRTNVFVEFRGKRVSLKEAAEMSGIKYQTVFSRIHLRGWSVEDALNKTVFDRGFTLTGKRKRTAALRPVSLDPSSYSITRGRKYTVLENRLRILAIRHGLFLTKSKARNPTAPTFSKYMILAHSTREICIGHGFSMTLLDVAKYISALMTAQPSP